MQQDAPASAPSRIVVRSPNWLGDAVMSLPFLRDLRRRFPSAQLAVATPAALEAFYRAVPGVNEVLEFRVGAGGSRWRDIEEHAAILRAGRFDVGILLPNSFGSALALWRAGIPERWGYRAGWRGWFLTRGVRRPRSRSEPLHQAQYYLELARALGADVQGLDVQVPVPEESRERALGILMEAGYDPSRAALVGMAPGAAYGGAKRWPTDRLAQVIERLTASGDNVCLLLGSPGDRATARAVDEGLAARVGVVAPATGEPPRIINFVGRTDLAALMGMLSHCRVVVSNDSGAMHLAAAIGRPVVATFGPTDERVTAPLGRHKVLQHPVRCRPCLLRECPIDHRCMKGISSVMVCEAVEEFLRAS